MPTSIGLEIVLLMVGILDLAYKGAGWIYGDLRSSSKDI